MKQFSDFHLKEATMAYIESCHFREPTPIQQEVIPSALRGQDVIGLSSTGSGKTHAYLLPILDRVDTSSKDIFAVITAPTRELAVQIYKVAADMKEFRPDLRIRLFIGGQDRQKDEQVLQKEQPHIVIGTPGRIKDLFLNEGLLRIDKAQVLVIDEADMTLEYGFLADVDAFAGRMKGNVQMLCFSATMPDALRPFIRKYMHHPITCEIGQTEPYAAQVEHVLVPCYHHSYTETIESILPGFQPYLCLVFANTREEASEIAGELNAAGIRTGQLHGGLTSRERKQMMQAIENNEFTYIVATDLAARGIDIPGISHVISCGFPQELEYYIHRAGRTGRAGQKGTCYALYHENDDSAIRSLQKHGTSFKHRRYKNGEWVNLRPYGQKREKPDDDIKKQISMIYTKKNEKVKPGYKKKRAAKIEKIHRQKKREFIREKIREEKKAMYRERAKKES